jgi:hypothetical protein
LENFTTDFGALPELINTYLKVLASAADVPVTRFLGISNSGLTQSAEGDLENYYNSLNRLQTHIGKAVKRITQILYLNLFGYDEEYEKIEVVFPPLWNLSDEEEEKIKSMKLEKILKAEEIGLMNADEAITEINQEKIFNTELSTKDLDLELPFHSWISATSDNSLNFPPITKPCNCCSKNAVCTFAMNNYIYPHYQVYSFHKPHSYAFLCVSYWTPLTYGYHLCLPLTIAITVTPLDRRGKMDAH